MFTVDSFQSISTASLLRIRSCWLVKKKIPKRLRKRSRLPSAHGLVFLRISAVNRLAQTSGPRWTVWGSQGGTWKSFFQWCLESVSCCLKYLTAESQKNPQLYRREHHDRWYKIWNLSRQGQFQLVHVHFYKHHTYAADATTHSVVPTCLRFPVRPQLYDAAAWRDVDAISGPWLCYFSKIFLTSITKPKQFCYYFSNF